jgi:hypothetical protein
MKHRRSVLVATVCAAATLGVAGPAYAFWSVGSSNAAGSAKADALGAPTASAAASGATIVITVSAAPASGPAPTGYRVDRTSPTSATGVCTITGATGSCTDTSPAAGSNAYAVYAKVGANWVAANAATASASTDTTPPTNALSLTAGTNAFLSGSGSPYTLYYRGNAAGSFKLVDAVADAGSGPASATFPAIGTTGWTHAAETVTTPSGGPYTSTAFGWTASPSNPGAYVVTGADKVGNTSTATVNFASDTAGPTGGSITYADGYYRTTSVAITLSTGTDAGSGVNAASAQVQRASASLSAGACGTFGSFSNVSLTGSADTSVTSGNCYKYQYVVADNVGNSTTYTSSSVAKVDAVAPAVTAVTLANGNGTAQLNDTVTVTYSEPMDESTFCSLWSGTGNQTIGGNNAVTVTITDNGANDTLTVSSTTCAFNFGSVALGGDYVSATTTFSGSGTSKSQIMYQQGTTTPTLVISLGAPNNAGNLKTVPSNGTPVYTAASGLTDLAGNALPTTPVNGTAGRL